MRGGVRGSGVKGMRKKERVRAWGKGSGLGREYQGVGEDVGRS